MAALESLAVITSAAIAVEDLIAAFLMKIVLVRAPALAAVAPGADLLGAAPGVARVGVALVRDLAPSAARPTS